LEAIADKWLVKMAAAGVQLIAGVHCNWTELILVWPQKILIPSLVDLFDQISGSPEHLAQWRLEVRKQEEDVWANRSQRGVGRMFMGQLS
jgi:hypothetical protein